MNLSRPDRRERLDRLAAEYALGTLPARPRARLARVARADPVVAAALSEWAARLAPLAAVVPAVAPPPRVWTGIRERLGLDPEPAVGGWWQRLALWRGLALASLAAVIALGVAVLAPRPGALEPAVVAVLAGADGKPALIATGSRGDATLRVKRVGAGPAGPGRTLQLWMLPDGRPPRSLGLVSEGEFTRVALAAPAGTALAGIPALAVSLEPAGGSPTGLPTGPVLYSGRVERFD